MDATTRSTLMFAVALAMITVGTSLVMVSMGSLAAAVVVCFLMLAFSLFLLMQYHSAITRLYQ